MLIYGWPAPSLCAAQVWIVYGDGSLGYSVAEYDTFTRHKVKYSSQYLHVLYGSHLDSGGKVQLTFIQQLNFEFYNIS